MADGYISLIKTPDNKTYLLKDSEKTDEKVKLTSNTEDKEFPIILKNTNNTTDETADVKYAGGVTVNPSDETVTASEFIGNLRSNKIIPITSQTFTGFYATANTDNRKVAFFGTITRTDVNIPWRIRLKILATIPNYPSYAYTDWDIDYWGFGAATKALYIKVNHGTNYALYSLQIYYPKDTTDNNILIGVYLYANNNYNNSAYARTLHIDYFSGENCNFTFNNNLIYRENITVANYTAVGVQLTSVGYQETGDTNTNDTSLTYERYNHTRLTCTTVFPRYSLAFTHATDSTKIIPVNSTENNVTDTKTTITTEAFNIFEKIYYKSDAPSTVLAANSLVSVSTLWYAYSTLDLRYSFNLTTSSLTAHKDVYLVCELVTPTTAILRGAEKTGTDASTLSNNLGPITLTLPASEDNLIYIKLGRSYSAYQITLTADHPIYWFKDGELRLYTGGRGIKSITRSGTTFTATRDDGSTFDFTLLDKYHKSGSWSGLTYTATAVNSADELKFTIPNKIQTNWELNTASGNSPALLFTRDSSLTDWKIFVTSGKLSFQSATDGSTWTERAYFKDNSGDFVATSFTGKGSALTDLNASNLSSGTVPVARLPLATTSAAGAVKVGSGISVSDGTISVTAANLGLSNAMHFIGIATKAISDGGTEDPTISGYSTKTAGDVVIDKDTRREYVWSTAGKWEMLGFDASAKYELTTSGNTFISKITLTTDGTVTAESRALDTSGPWSGNAATATKFKDDAGNTTKVFYRGDNTWSNILKQTAASALGIDTNHKIGTAIKDLHFTVGSGSGTGINDGNAGGITIGTDTASYGGIYWLSSGSYGLRLHFATTGSFANGAYTRMLITHDGKVGIGTLTPDTLLTVNGNAKADKFIGALLGNADTATSAGKWTTARTLTIGNTGKSVDGSGAVSWSLAEIGAAPASTVSCTTANVQSALGINTSSGSTSKALTEKGTWVTFGTSNLTIGTTSTTAMAGNTTVTNVAISANVTTDANYPIVFTTSNKDTTSAKNEGLLKSGTKFYFNPSTGNVQATTFNGYTLAAASAKGVVTTIDTSANLPTSNAVKSFVEGKGYTTNTGTVTSVKLILGAGITVSSSGTAITTTGERTISITGMDTTNGSTTKWLNLKGGWSTPTAANVGALASSTVVTNVAISANTVANDNYPIVFATSNTNTTAAKNEGLQKSGTKFFAHPSTGALYATKFCVDESVTLQYNDTDKSLEFIF